MLSSSFLVTSFSSLMARMRKQSVRVGSVRYEGKSLWDKGPGKLLRYLGHVQLSIPFRASENDGDGFIFTVRLTNERFQLHKMFPSNQIVLTAPLNNHPVFSNFAAPVIVFIHSP